LRGKDREGPVARWRWMRRRDAEAEGVVVGKKKLIAMPEDLPSEWGVWFIKKRSSTGEVASVLNFFFSLHAIAVRLGYNGVKLQA